MKKMIIIVLSVVAILVLAGVVVGLTGFYKFNFAPFANFGVKSDPLNITYAISGQDYTLTNGRVEKEIAPGSASKDVVTVYGKVVMGDLNGDGVPDATMILTQNAGGSGTFFYVVEAINVGGVFKPTNAMLIGDRIAPQNITILDGKVLVNYADRKPGESFDVQPSLGKNLYVKLDTTSLQISEFSQSIENATSTIN